jgi:hypothetical protein
MALYDLTAREVATLLAALKVYTFHFSDSEVGSAAHALASAAGPRLTPENIDGLANRLSQLTRELTVVLSPPSPFHPESIDELNIIVPEHTGWSPVRDRLLGAISSLRINGVAMNLEAFEKDSHRYSATQNNSKMLDALYAAADPKIDRFQTTPLNKVDHVIFATPVND